MEKLSSWTDFQSSFPGALIEAAVSAGLYERGRGPLPPSRDAASSRSAANGADSIIIIKFNWHATPWPIVAVVLNGLDFLPGCFPSDRFCFASRRTSFVYGEWDCCTLSKMNFSNIYIYNSFNWLSIFENCRRYWIR